MAGHRDLLGTLPLQAALRTHPQPFTKFISFYVKPGPVPKVSVSDERFYIWQFGRCKKPVKKAVW